MELPVGYIHSMPEKFLPPDCVPQKWFFTDGRELPREDFVELFDVIGERFGAGDGLTTFLIPNRPAEDGWVFIIKVLP